MKTFYFRLWWVIGLATLIGLHGYAQKKKADFDRGGRSVLAIRPLLWKNDWPVAGEVFKEGTYEIESERRGYGLELCVDFIRMEGGRHRFWEKSEEPIKPLKRQYAFTGQV